MSIIEIILFGKIIAYHLKSVGAFLNKMNGAPLNRSLNFSHLWLDYNGLNFDCLMIKMV